MCRRFYFEQLIDYVNFYFSPLTGNRWFCFLIFYSNFISPHCFPFSQTVNCHCSFLGLRLFLVPWDVSGVRSPAALFKDACGSQAYSSASQSQAGRPVSLMIFNQYFLLYSNFPLLTRLLTAGWAKAARWACWLWTRTHAHLEQQLGSLGHLKSHCMPVGVLTCTHQVWGSGLSCLNVPCADGPGAAEHFKWHWVSSYGR